MPFGMLFLLSVLAGLVGALGGMGGGVVLIPVLTFVGINIKQAIAVSGLSAIAISNSATPLYVRRHLPNLKAGAFLELFAVMGALTGAVITVLSHQRFLYLFCGVTLVVSWVALWKTWKKENKPALESQSPAHPSMLTGSYYDHAEHQTISYKGKRPYLGGVCMFGVGLVSGLLGVGTGAFTVLINDLLMGFPTKVSLTMSNLMMGAIYLAGVGVYLEAGLIHSKLVAPIILGVPFGALLGAKLLPQLRNQMIRIVFLCILSVLGLEMMVQGIWGF